MAGKTGSFDWPALMRAGIGGLRLAPADFWALTPVELMLLLGVEGRSAPMGRDRLMELARAFPDRAADKERSDGEDRGT